MPSEKKPPEKTRLHPRNRNRERYDLIALTDTTPELKSFVATNKFGIQSIDFSNPRAVKLLNKAILNYYYGIKEWDFPDQNLCPPVPGRADYIHTIADLMAENNSGIIPKGNKITCLDVGTGASCIYPVIGVAEYGWQFIGSDIDKASIASAQRIVLANSSLAGKIECRLQPDPKHIFQGIINREEKVDVTLCNPPFHTSVEEARKGSRRKVKNLTGRITNAPVLNFAGISNELIYAGGEYTFIERMIQESILFSKNCFWFTTLVSKESNLKGIYQLLKKSGANEVKTIPLGTGNKISRIVAWTFLSGKEKKDWVERNWQ